MKCSLYVFSFFTGYILFHMMIPVNACSNGCAGSCDLQNKCKCKPGWYGDTCSHVYAFDCYNTTDKGSSYNGTLDTAETGAKCLNWKFVSNIYAQYYEDHNYCRHPVKNYSSINNIKKPWCYIQSDKSNDFSRLCNVPQCECEPGYYGSNCGLQCHCATTGCDVSGQCHVGGCEDGWTGNTCSECTPGYYGSNCDRQCYCATPGCNRNTGQCLTGGCLEEWTGDTCSECKPSRFGPNCRYICHCEDGKCDNTTGVCSIPGCLTGWTGESCNYTTDCKLAVSDNNYHGNISITMSNITCRNWSEAGKPYHVLEKNYCRAPVFDTDTKEPWCYTLSGIPIWEPCHIPLCVCLPGYYGENCENQCHCATGECNVTTGICYNQTAGCRVPWTGNSCSTLFQCPNLNNVPQQIHPTKLTGYHVGDVVSFLCNVGFVLSGAINMACVVNESLSGGKWNEMQPGCSLITCSKESLIKNGSFKVSDNRNSYGYNDIAAVTCADGYNGSSVDRKCIGVNTWTNQEPYCTRLYSGCQIDDHPKSLQHSPEKTKFNTREQVTFYCTAGFIGVTVTSICIGQNKWTKQPPECLSVFCTFDNNTIGVLVNPEKAEYSYDEQVIFTCLPGFYGTSRSSKCGSNNIWKPLPPHCSKMEAESLKGISYSVFGGVVSSIIAMSAFLVIISFMFLRKRFQKRHKEYEEIHFNNGHAGATKKDETYTELNEVPDYLNSEGSHKNH